MTVNPQTEQRAQQLLEPLRQEIDRLDRQLIDLLAKRMAVVHQVSKIKYDHQIPAILPSRVDKVREQAIAWGAAQGLDKTYLANLWTVLIEEACRIEQSHFDDWAKKSK